MPVNIWKYFLRDIDTASEAIILELYECWKIYWEKQAAGYDRVEYYAAALEKADKHFSRYTEKLRISPDQAVEFAWDTDSFDLILILALTIRKLCGNDGAFFKTFQTHGHAF